MVRRGARPGRRRPRERFDQPSAGAPLPGGSRLARKRFARSRKIPRIPGAIPVKGGPGKGSIFRAYFPALPASVRQKIEAPALRRCSEGLVMIVDDEEFIPSMAQRTPASAMG